MYKIKPSLLNPVNNILYRSVVTPFYRQIAGAFYFLFFVVFGIQHTPKDTLETHYYIIISILENRGTFVIYAILCILYFIKCISFYANRVTKNEYHFLQTLNGLSAAKRFTGFAFTGFLLLLPVIIYTLLIIIVGVSAGKQTGLYSPVSLALVLIAVTIFCLDYLNRKAAFLSAHTFFRLKRQPATLWWFLLKYMFREQFLALVIIKLISFCCIYFFVITDESVFESRMMWLIFMLCLAAHSVIIYKNFYFIEDKLNFYRSLPLQPFAILASLFFCYAILLIPEYWALRALAVSHGNIYEYCCILIAAPAILTLLHVLLYTDDLKMDGYLSLVFLVWMLFFFAGFTQTKWLIPAIALSALTIVFYTSFRNFEKVAGKKN
ncbi:MAG: hypothetical protein QM640_12820 [Niabella sp.]